LNKKREADASLGNFNFKRFFKPEWLFNTPSLYPYACPPSQPGGAFREPRAEHSANPRRGIWKRIRAFKFGFGDFFLTIFFAFANTIFEMIFKF
jgi:hypothetical protein